MAGGPCYVAGTEGAAFRGEPIVVLLALITLRANNSRSAEALASEDVTCGVEGALCVAVAVLATFPAADVPEPVTAGVTVLPDHVGLALAFARVGVADGQLVDPIVVLVRVVGSQWVALAHVALLLLQASRHKSISVEAGLTGLTVETRGVVYATEAFASGPVTVANSTWVDVPVAIALLARPGRTVESIGIPKVPILTHLTSRASATHGTFCAEGGLGVAWKFKAHAWPPVAGCILNIGARARLARVHVPREGISKVAFGAEVAFVPSSVVLAFAHSVLRVTVV